MRADTTLRISLAVTHARTKHPGYIGQLSMLAALMEEVGEVAKAIIEDAGEDAVKSELAQVAAVCVRMIEKR